MTRRVRICHIMSLVQGAVADLFPESVERSSGFEGAPAPYLTQAQLHPLC